jgi:hypothetical protein
MNTTEGLIHPVCGGDGLDGPFNEDTYNDFDTDGDTLDNIITLDPDRTEGPYRFTSFILESQYTITAPLGSLNPLVIYATGDIDIVGDIDLQGQRGEDAISTTEGSGNPHYAGLGGIGKAGGGAGGNGGDLEADGDNPQNGGDGGGHIVNNLADWTGVEYGDGVGGRGGEAITNVGKFAGTGGGGGYATEGERANDYPSNEGPGGTPERSGLGGLIYGHFSLDQYAGLLLAGSGAGGGGARDSIYTTVEYILPGCGGGAGGGGLYMASSKAIRVLGEIFCSGGDGGEKGSDQQQLAPGGGGSGGNILFHSSAYFGGGISLGSASILSVAGGPGGVDIENAQGRQYYGGNGGAGRIRMECPNIEISTGAQLLPEEDINMAEAAYEDDIYPYQWSVGTTKWLRTEPWSSYHPLEYSDNSAAIDSAIASGILPEGTKIRYWFQGTRPKVENENQASDNPEHWTAWTQEISNINNLPFIRVKIEFYMPFTGEHKYRKDDGAYQELRPEVYDITITYEY